MNSLVFSNILHRPARTFVSVLGIGVGILLIVFTIGLANGSLRERAQRESNIGAEIMFRASGSIGLSGSDSLRLPVSMVPEVLKVDGVASVIPIAQNSVPASDGITGSRFVDGVPYEQYAAVAGLQVMQGRVMADGKDEMMSDVAWLERRKMKIGDKFEIYDRDFTVVGTYEPSAGARIKIPLSTMQEQLGADGKASAFLIKLREGFTPQMVGDSLNARFPESQIILTSELEELYMQGLPALNVFLDVVVGVAGAISALIILLTMYTTVTERTRQIGVLKSLGMSKLNIGWTIVQEALLISLGGVIFGVLATFILKFALGKWTTLTVSVDPQLIGAIILIGMVSGVIGALYPGIRAARLDAVEALNYD
ncbi:MAG: ABC transporter permease [Acidobacteria bacterium]|nr:ABC transporter permease [Acidobacteriota bacterium]MBP9109914.1 ABC transporter permease [Pyrinomonadaceae bacterium]